MARLVEEAARQPWLLVILVVAGSFAAIFATIFIGVFIFKAQTLLPRWAKQNRYRIIEYEMRHYDRGPFLWTTNRVTQPVYHVTLQDPHGNRRRAWIAFGSWWRGPFLDKVQVR